MRHGLDFFDNLFQSLRENTFFCRSSAIDNKKMMESTKILELVVLAQFSCKSCVCCSLHICHNNIYVYLSPFDLF